MMNGKFYNIKRKNAQRMDYEFRNGISHVTSYPTTIGVAVNKTCNVKCVFCLVGDSGSSKIDWTHFQKLNMLFPYVEMVTFSGEEVILHPNIWEMFEFVKRYEVCVSFFTNGKLLKPEVMRRLVDCGVDQIHCSFHGATPQTYNSIVLKADFKSIVEQFNYLKRYRFQRLRETGKAPNPRVIFHYVVMRKNIEELPRFLELAAHLGADGVLAKYMMIYSHIKHLINESLYFYPELTNKVIDHCTAKVANMQLKFSPPIKFSIENDGEQKKLDNPSKESNDDYPPCSWPWRQCNISVNGDVIPCCGGLGPMGNIYENSFEEVWNNEKYIDLRATVNTPNRWPECRQCSYWATAPEIDDIQTHLVYLKGPGQREVDVNPLDIKGLFTVEENLSELIWQAFVEYKSCYSDRAKPLNEILSMVKEEERAYLTQRFADLKYISENIFLLLMIRFLNRFDHYYVAYGLLKKSVKLIDSTKNVSVSLFEQIIVENFYSEMGAGFFQNAVAAYERTVRKIIPHEIAVFLDEMFNEQEWNRMKTKLDEYLETTLNSLNPLVSRNSSLTA